MTTPTDTGVSRTRGDFGTSGSVIATTPALVAARQRFDISWRPDAEGWDPQPCEDSPARNHRVDQAEPHPHTAGQTSVARHADTTKKSLPDVPSDSPPAPVAPPTAPESVTLPTPPASSGPQTPSHPLHRGCVPGFLHQSTPRGLR